MEKLRAMKTVCYKSAFTGKLNCDRYEGPDAQSPGFQHLRYGEIESDGFPRSREALNRRGCLRLPVTMTIAIVEDPELLRLARIPESILQLPGKRHQAFATVSDNAPVSVGKLPFRGQSCAIQLGTRAGSRPTAR